MTEENDGLEDFGFLPASMLSVDSDYSWVKVRLDPENGELVPQKITAAELEEHENRYIARMEELGLIDQEEAEDLR